MLLPGGRVLLAEELPHLQRKYRGKQHADHGEDDRLAALGRREPGDLALRQFGAVGAPRAQWTRRGNWGSVAAQLGPLPGVPNQRAPASLVVHPLLEERLGGLPQVEVGIELATEPFDVEQGFLQRYQLRLDLPSRSGARSGTVAAGSCRTRCP